MAAPEPMDPTVASAVLDAAKALPRRMSSREAEGVVRTWLRARGFTPDAWGNFVLPSGLRYHFDNRTLRVQSKRSGTWRDRRAYPMTQAAEDLLIQAAEALGDAEALTRWSGAQKKREDEKGKRAEKAEFARLQDEARNLAMARVADEYRDAVWAHMRSPGKSPLPAEVSQAYARYTTSYVDRLRTGGKLPDLGLFSSIDRPSIVPFFFDRDYHWYETLDDVIYSVQLRHQEPGIFADQRHRVAVQIGYGGALGLTIDPYTMHVSSRLSRNTESGDGQLVGRLWDDGEAVRATLTIVIAQEKRKGAGSRLMQLWCRMMAGYGVKVWEAEGVGDEGAPFLVALHDRGAITLLKQSGSSVYATCGRPAGAPTTSPRVAPSSEPAAEP